MAPGGNSITASTGTNWADPVHDAAGNMTTIPSPQSPASSLSLKFDPWNRLVEVKNSSYAVLTTNEFDGLGRRIRRVNVAANPDVAYDYFYNEQWQLLEERKNADTDPLSQYVWHPYYIDALAVRYWDYNTDGDYLDNYEGAQYFLHDANFNITAVMNSSSTVLERYHYSPYGEVTFMDSSFAPRSSSLIDNPHLYTGRERDPETGLQLNRHRFYHPPLGRWVNRDPIGYIGGLNLFRYAGVQPMRFLDATGLFEGPLPPPDSSLWPQNQPRKDPLEGLKEHLYAMCETLGNVAAVKQCKSEVDKLIEELRGVHDSLREQGGPKRFNFMGPVCTDCEKEVCDAIGGRPAECFFEYRTITKEIGPDHVWGEIHFHDDKNTVRVPGKIACTIDMWGSFDHPWDPNENGFGWTADEDYVPYCPPECDNSLIPGWTVQ